MMRINGFVTNCLAGRGVIVVGGVMMGSLLSVPAPIAQAPTAQAQTNPQQLEALGRLQDAQDQRHMAAERAAQAAIQAQRQAQISAQRRREADSLRRQAALEKTRQEQAVIAQKKADELAAAQAREREADARYLAEKRALELSEQRFKLKLEQARADHADAFVQGELKRQDAETDTVSATNEGIRNVSGAIKTKAVAEGQAEKMKARHWWNFWE